MCKCIAVVCLMLCVTSGLLFAGEQTGKPSKEAFVQKAQKIQMPFIANEGQADERVKYYANTFGGTVCVTKEGGIVYMLPKRGEVQSGTIEPARETCYLSVRADVFSTPQWALWLNNKWWEEITQKASEDDASIKSVNRNPQSTIRNQRGVALKEELVGGKTGDISGEKISGAVVSYFKGNDPSKWKRGIATYEMVSLGEVYKGIELKLKAHGNNVEKLFYVKPGANPEQIRVSLSGLQPQENPPHLSPSVRGTGGCPPLAGAGGGVGARGLLHQELWVNEHGELVAETALGPVKFTKPVAYQEIDGKRVEVECGYAMADGGLQNAEYKTNPKSKFRNLSPTPIGEQKSAIRNLKSEIDNPSHTYGFKVASYDKNHDLIIDPLLASTFLGGDARDVGYGIALDSSGNVFVTGETADGATDLPTTLGAYDTTHNGYSDVFVSKFSNDLTSLLASTFLGGDSDDYGYGIALDSGGNVFVTGWTVDGTTDLPTTSGAYDTTHNGYEDVFVSKFSNDLTSLLASTFLGGDGDDWGRGIALDSSGNVFVTGMFAPGYTDDVTNDLPTTSGAYDTNHNGYGGTEVFVSKFNNDLTSLLASTYLGENSGEIGYGIALDSSDNVFVTGWTSDGTTDLPTTSGAYDTTHNGGTQDVFVSKFSNDLTGLLASTFLGGGDIDWGSGIALDSSDNVFVTGWTVDGTTDLPTTAGAYDTTHNGGLDVFVSKFSNDLTSLSASTFLGGDSDDWGYGIALDSGGNVFVTGWTGDGTTDLPTTSGAYDTTHNGGTVDVFVSKFSNDLTGLLASTFLGGDSDDYGYGIALDSSDNVFATGLTVDGTTDLPTTAGAYDTTHNGSGDVFVSKFDNNLSGDTDPTPTPSPSPEPSPTPTVEPTSTYVPTPTLEPTPEPTPTSEPTPQPSPTEPQTAVELMEFKARATADGIVVLKWKTASEVNNAGFNIHRARHKDGRYAQVNNAIISAKGGTSEASYRYEDTPGKGTFYYKLEDVDTNGVSTTHGPVKVRVGSAGGEARRRR